MLERDLPIGSAAPYVCPSDHSLQAGAAVSQPVTEGLQFSETNFHTNFPRRTPTERASSETVVSKNGRNADFRPISRYYLGNDIDDTHIIVTMDD